jgi:hypothetical protein
MAKGLLMMRATLRDDRPAVAVTDCTTPTYDGGTQIPSVLRPVYDAVHGGRRPVRAHRPPEGSAVRPGES